MNAPNPDTRSIGQVLYEANKQIGWPSWEQANSKVRDRCERGAEEIFNRGFKAGGEAQKTAAPTPKAKQYRDALALLLAEVKHALPQVLESPEREALKDRIVKAEAVLR